MTTQLHNQIGQLACGVVGYTWRDSHRSAKELGGAGWCNKQPVQIRPREQEVIGVWQHLEHEELRRHSDRAALTAS